MAGNGSRAPITGEEYAARKAREVLADTRADRRLRYIGAGLVVGTYVFVAFEAAWLTHNGHFGYGLSWGGLLVGAGAVQHLDRLIPRFGQRG